MGSLSTIVFAIFTLLSVRAIRLSSISMAPKGTTFDLAAALSSPTAPQITDFDRKVYEACSRVPAGKVTTYKDIARVIGSERAFRAVGTSLRKNPFAPQVPCHRVVASDLSLGGFQGSKDPMGDCLSKKRTMLAAEGVHFATEKPKARTMVPATIGKKRKLSADKSEGTASVRIAEDSVYRF